MNLGRPRTHFSFLPFSPTRYIQEVEFRPEWEIRCQRSLWVEGKKNNSF